MSIYGTGIVLVMLIKRSNLVMLRNWVNDIW
jgi:hypothetical protein